MITTAENDRLYDEAAAKGLMMMVAPDWAYYTGKPSRAGEILGPVCPHCNANDGNRETCETCSGRGYLVRSEPLPPKPTPAERMNQRVMELFLGAK